MPRLRFDLTAEPARLVRLGFSAHDARAFGFRFRDDLDSTADKLDVRQAWIELGEKEDSGWKVRLGRQELSFGDERLIGADSEWSNIGRSFDAVRVSFRSGDMGFDLFTAAPVIMQYRSWNRTHPSERIQGAYAWLQRRGTVLGAYEFRTSDGQGGILRHTFGTHVRGDLGHGFDHNVEVALQRGKIAGLRIRSWAGHWELGKTLSRRDSAPRLWVEYNYASGDADASDRRHGSFNDLYAAAYNKYGMSDPFSARNLQNAEVGLEHPAGRHVRVTAGFRAYWLASGTDGVYTGGDEPALLPCETCGRRIADHLNVSVVYRPSPLWQIAGGYGRLLWREVYRAAGQNGPAA
jgi:Alginate export